MNESLKNEAKDSMAITENRRTEFLSCKTPDAKVNLLKLFTKNALYQQ